MEPNEYECARCGGIFEKARPDDEAMAEALPFFPTAATEDMVTVCDDCWQFIKPSAPVFRPIEHAPSELHLSIFDSLLAADPYRLLIGRDAPSATTTMPPRDPSPTVESIMQSIKDVMNSGVMHATAVSEQDRPRFTWELPPAHASATPIFYSPFIMRETEERLFPFSRHRSRRIHKKLIKKHGSEYRQVPTMYQTKAGIFAHPSFKTDLAKLTGDVERPASPPPDSTTKEN